MNESTHRVAATTKALLLSQRANDRLVEGLGDMPGVVIFLHGVNDPGASYQPVEEGLCQGLNDRLNRTDLKPGAYGKNYGAAKHVLKENLTETDKQYLDDPDTWLYRRDDRQGEARSVLIPFYWGCRASADEIKREVVKDEATGKMVSRHATIRGQYLDSGNNRLDRHFAKGGGFFQNATNNIPEMYGKGFEASPTTNLLSNWDKYLHFGTCTHRRYLVLAAERLAMLISEIRRVDPNETVTVIGHSQGTLITLLAQALLVDRGQRCADTVIMVATPYSVIPDAVKARAPGHDSLSALMRIVAAITLKPHNEPDLNELLANHPAGKDGGRAGPDWSPAQGKRLGPDGKTCVFGERDNRGKVYLYFCPEDSVVGLKEVRGIGAFGVPDQLPDGKAAMTALNHLRFFQRMWTKRHAQGYPIKIGRQPQHELLRAKGEPRYPSGFLTGLIAHAPIEVNDERWINAEALNPQHAPQMFGGEVDGQQGTPTSRGMDRPDDVMKNIALAHPRAEFPLLPLPPEFKDKKSNEEQLRARYNAQFTDPDDQTRMVINMGNEGMMRELTPNEARNWMATDNSNAVLQENSYHSAILRDASNQRWVTAMDVAVGQAKCLDDSGWRDLFLAIANWRMTEKLFDDVKGLPYYSRLSAGAQALVRANFMYYEKGEFPDESLVPIAKQPSLVTGDIKPLVETLI
jgi:pimeloyl-ACP methyl ester carboxylesterase